MVKNFIVCVDGYRRPSRKRNTAGMYRVGAKNEEEAIKLVRKAIGFGSPIVTREDQKQLVPYRTVRRIAPNGTLLPVRRATDPIFGKAKNKK